MSLRLGYGAEAVSAASSAQRLIAESGSASVAVRMLLGTHLLLIMCIPRTVL